MVSQRKVTVKGNCYKHKYRRKEKDNNENKLLVQEVAFYIERCFTSARVPHSAGRPDVTSWHFTSTFHELKKLQLQHNCSLIQCQCDREWYFNPFSSNLSEEQFTKAVSAFFVNVGGGFISSSLPGEESLSSAAPPPFCSNLKSVLNGGITGEQRWEKLIRKGRSGAKARCTGRAGTSR